VEAYNAEALALFEESQPKCVCGRSFNPEKLAAHMRGCSAVKEAGGGSTRKRSLAAMPEGV